MEFDPKRKVGGLIDPKRNVGWLILLSSKCVGLRVRVYLTVMLEKVFECLANVCISYTEGLDTVYSVREQQLPTTGCSLRRRSNRGRFPLCLICSIQGEKKVSFQDRL